VPYVIDGRTVELEHEPRNLNGPIYVPLREVMDALGGAAGWDKTTNTADATLAGRAAQIFPNSTTIRVAGQWVNLSMPPVMAEGVTWVPVEFFQAAFGRVAYADAATNTVTV
jgi:hypothetical protein